MCEVDASRCCIFLSKGGSSLAGSATFKVSWIENDNLWSLLFVDFSLVTPNRHLRPKDSCAAKRCGTFCNRTCYHSLTYAFDMRSMPKLMRLTRACVSHSCTKMLPMLEIRHFFTCSQPDSHAGKIGLLLLPNEKPSLSTDSLNDRSIDIMCASHVFHVFLVNSPAC